MKTIMNKKDGMTLVELIVYIAIALLVVAPIVMLLHNSSLNMTRDAGNTDLRITGRDVLNVMFDDLKNTGFKIKSMAEGLPWDSRVEYHTVTYIDTITPLEDSSSFNPVDNGVDGAFDELTILKGVLNANRIWIAHDTITYWVDTITSDRGNLMRKFIRTYVDGFTPRDSTTTLVARNVEALQFMYSSDLVEWDNGDYFDDIATDDDALEDKKYIKYIKIFVVLRNDSQAGAVKNTPGMKVGNFTLLPAGAPILREQFEIVVPIPNNGLYPPPPPPSGTPTPGGNVPYPGCDSANGPPYWPPPCCTSESCF